MDLINRLDPWESGSWLHPLSGMLKEKYLSVSNRFRHNMTKWLTETFNLLQILFPVLKHPRWGSTSPVLTDAQI